MFLQKRSYTDTFGTVTHVLAPCDADGESRLSRMQDGQKVSVQSKKVSNRSYRQLAMFFAFLKRVHENQEQFPTVDALREALLIEAGHTELREKLNGERYYVARSISYKESAHEEFTALFDRVVDIACKQWGFDREELLHGVER